MKSINRVVILGRVGKDPEMRYSSTGKAMATLNVATSYKKKDRPEESEWHRITFFEKQAEFIEKYIEKGNLVHVEGRLKTSKYKDKQTGQDRYITNILGTDIIGLGGGGSKKNMGGQPVSNASAYPTFDDGGSDIPF